MKTEKQIKKFLMKLNFTIFGFQIKFETRKVS